MSVAHRRTLPDQLLHLEQTHLTRRGLAVPNVGLRCAHGQWRRATGRAVHRRKRARLRRVAERRARAVSLRVLHLRRRERRAPEGTLQ